MSGCCCNSTGAAGASPPPAGPILLAPSGVPLPGTVGTGITPTSGSPGQTGATGGTGPAGTGTAGFTQSVQVPSIFETVATPGKFPWMFLLIAAGIAYLISNGKG